MRGERIGYRIRCAHRNRTPCTRPFRGTWIPQGADSGARRSTAGADETSCWPCNARVVAVGIRPAILASAASGDSVTVAAIAAVVAIALLGALIRSHLGRGSSVTDGLSRLGDPGGTTEEDWVKAMKR